MPRQGQSSSASTPASLPAETHGEYPSRPPDVVSLDFAHHIPNALLHKINIQGESATSEFGLIESTNSTRALSTKRPAPWNATRVRVKSDQARFDDPPPGGPPHGGLALANRHVRAISARAERLDSGDCSIRRHTFECYDCEVWRNALPLFCESARRQPNLAISQSRGCEMLRGPNVEISRSPERNCHGGGDRTAASGRSG